MSVNNQTTSDNEIDLREIILTSWKEKYLIFIITLVFTVVGYIYGTLQPKVYQTTSTLRDVPELIFQKHEAIFSTHQRISHASNFNEYFKLNLMSLDNLVKFVEQNKKIDEFKSYLKTNSIKTSDYFNGKFQLVPDKKNVLKNQYKLNYSSKLPGAEFLNDYIIFTKHITAAEFNEYLKKNIENEIKIINHNLEIANTINLENPFIKPNDRQYTIVNEPNALFYKDSKVLYLQKSNLENTLKELDNYIIDYNPFLEVASSQKLVSLKVSILMGVAFVLGFFFSVIIIFIKKNF